MTKLTLDKTKREITRFGASAEKKTEGFLGSVAKKAGGIARDISKSLEDSNDKTSTTAINQQRNSETIMTNYTKAFFTVANQTAIQYESNLEYQYLHGIWEAFNKVRGSFNLDLPSLVQNINSITQEIRSNPDEYEYPAAIIASFKTFLRLDAILHDDPKCGKYFQTALYFTPILPDLCEYTNLNTCTLEQQIIANFNELIVTCSTNAMNTASPSLSPSQTVSPQISSVKSEDPSAKVATPTISATPMPTNLAQATQESTPTPTPTVDPVKVSGENDHAAEEL